MKLPFKIINIFKISLYIKQNLTNIFILLFVLRFQVKNYQKIIINVN
jgi:hypothetical protein